MGFISFIGLCIYKWIYPFYRYENLLAKYKNYKLIQELQKRGVNMEQLDGILKRKPILDVIDAEVLGDMPEDKKGTDKK